MAKHFHEKPNMYVSHIQLKVSNLARSLEFYEKVIGFKVLERSGERVYLTTDGKSSPVSLVQIEDAVHLRRGQTGLYHLALLLPTRRDLGNLLQHLIDMDVRFGGGDHHVSEAIYLEDPDGNGIELYADRSEDSWIWQNDAVYMTTEALDYRDILDAGDGNWTGLSEGTILGYVHLSVADIDATRDFYTKILDYSVVNDKYRKAIFVSTGNYHHHLAFNAWYSEKGLSAPDNAVGLKSFTIVLKDVPYAEEVKNKLKAADYPVEIYDEEPRYGGKQSFSTVDDNGFRILFTVEAV